MKTKEIWKDIKNYEGYYQISNKGRVKRLKRKISTTKPYQPFKIQPEKILKGGYNKGYIDVNLCKNNITKKFKVHRLVAQAFIDNPLNKEQVNHKDGNRNNNNVENLEWVTNIENQQHSWRELGRISHRKGQKIPQKTKNKIKEYWTNNNHPKSKKVYCVELNMTFDSIKDAESELNISHHIHQVCNGIRHTCGGYHWKWILEGKKNGEL